MNLFGQFQHPLQGLVGGGRDLRGDLDLVVAGLQHVDDLVQSDGLHVRADGGGLGEVEPLAGVLPFQIVADAHLGADDVLGVVMLGGILDDAGGGTDVVCQGQHLLGTFGVDQHLGGGMGLLQSLQLLRLHEVVDGAVAVQHHHILLRDLLRHKAAQILVGDEENVLVGQGLDHLYRVGGSDADVRPGLDLGGGVDVAHHGQVGVLRPHPVHVFLPDHVGHGAVGVEVRHQDLLVGGEELAALAHEVHPAVDNDGVGQALGLLTEIKGVSNVVRNGLDLRLHIVVSQDHGVFLRLQGCDFLLLCHSILDSRACARLEFVRVITYALATV